MSPFAESTLLDPARIATLLGPAARRFNVEAIAECPSTNTLLMARTAAPSGAVLVADRQTAGRGRRGRQWMSAQHDATASLTFSLLWRLPPGVAPAGLALAVGLALARASDRLGAAGVMLKWPNDLLADAGDGLGKLGGILIELSGGRDGMTAVIGIGLNLAPPDLPPTEPRAVGLSALGRRVETDRHRILATLLQALLPALDGFTAHGFAPLRAAWEARNAFAGQAVRLLEDGGGETHGRCLGVDDDGALRVDTDRGVVRWLAGDVSLRRA